MSDGNNITIKVLQDTPHGQLGVNEKNGELVFRQQIIHSGVEKFYSKWGAAHSLIHSVKMLSTPRLWKESLMTVGGGIAAVAIGGPIVLTILGGLLFNGVQMKAGVPGLNTLTKTGSGASPVLEVNYWTK